MISIRIKGINTHYMYRDVVDIVEQAGNRLVSILNPKVGVHVDVYMVCAMLTQIEEARGITNPIAIEVLIETILGLANVEAIGTSSKRLKAMYFGFADYAASSRALTVNIGGLNPDYLGDQWHDAISRMLVACRAFWLHPIDDPFRYFKDPEGYILGANRAAALGYEGKWAIHPSQIELVNSVFSPPKAEVQRTLLILTTLEEAAAAGKGAASLNSRLIDAVSAWIAENVVKQIELIQSKSEWLKV